MELQDAFEHLISQRKWYEKAGIVKSNAEAIKNRFTKQKKNLSEDNMRKILKASGYEIIVVEKWRAPDPEPIIIEKVVRRKARERKKPKPKEIVVVRTLIEPEAIKKVYVKSAPKKKQPTIESEYSTKSKLRKK